MNKWINEMFMVILMFLNGNKFRIIYKMFLKFNNELYICSCKNLYIWIYYGKDDEFFSYNN